MKFSLIICGYNEEDNLDLCINSCLNQDYSKDNYEIIYVDNNSKDNSLQIAKKYPIKTFTEKKQGPSEARNNGIQKSQGEILIFLDADTKLTKNYLQNIEKSFKNGEVGASGGKVLPLRKTIISNYFGVSLFEKYPRFIKQKELRNYPSCNLAVKRDVFEKVGTFKDEYGKTLSSPRGEDKELCRRIRKNGYKILYNPCAVIYHKNRSTLKELFYGWVKGSKGREYGIKSGEKDIFSLLFKYNFPIVYTSLFLLSLFFNLYLSFGLFLFSMSFILILSLKEFIQTKLFFESFFVKPILDAFSLLIINVSILYYKGKNDS